ncbi:carbon-nitrogen hydrolase family protein [Lacrimispora sp. NSJ-141]|uniref:Carbon-nitrogen hydrolase family protein n=1 Tax=Lientehia hominis TaxID=2897778 RepID=A0AAP2RF61_9FIRM|nr:carbon-nitrogen hydrolase family protein [Lientehia hominis]MCD2491117.1 carbon-nitrogen hydrolase family protein [Lientehia hominis]
MKLSCKVSMIQMRVRKTKEDSLIAAGEKIKAAARDGADFVILPEMFACPYETENFPVYAEDENGESVRRLSSAAAENHVYLIGGSLPERDDAGKIYNTSFVFDREGRIIAKHRKSHLFDIDIKGGQYFKESDTLTPGDKATVFSTEFGMMGLCICYDIRFPELFRRMVEDGANMVFCPAAFNRTTGPRHWELLFRSRAVDNQIFVAGISPAADENASYIAYGHSILVSPWGEILYEAGEDESILTKTIDLTEVERVREQLPLLKHRRKEIY